MVGLNKISIDEIKQNRYLIKKNTNDNALLLMQYANEPSKNLMLSLLDTFNSEIELADNEEEMSTLSYELLFDFCNVFEKEDNKYSLLYRQSQILDYMYELKDELDDNFEDTYQYRKLFYETNMQLQSTTTVEEANVVFQNWLIALKVIPYEYTDYEYVDYYISKIRYDLYNFSEYFTNVTDIENVYYEYYDLISNVDNLLDALIYYVEGYEKMHDLYMKQQVINYGIDADETLSYMTSIAIDSESEILEIYNIIGKTYLEISINEDILYTAYQYIEMMYSVTIDEIREAKVNIIDAIEEKFEELSVLATAESIIKMQAEVDKYKGLILAATTVEDIWLLYDNGKVAINDLYYEDDQENIQHYL